MAPRSLLLFGLAGLWSGCAMFAKPVDSLDVIKAKQARDVAFIDAVCAGQKKVAHPNVQTQACAVKQDMDASASTDCATLVERFTASPKTSEVDADALGRQFETCGLYPEFFETAAWFGSGQVMNEFDDGKLEAAFVAYAGAHTGARFLPDADPVHAGYAMRHLGTWLADHGHLGHCAAVTRAVTGAAEDVRAWALPYFVAATCADATPVAVGLLASTDPEHRKWACDALAAFGDQSAVSKLQGIATHDPFEELRDEQSTSGRVYTVKAYPIREACSEAAGQIALRGGR